MISAIYDRRSTRKFINKPISHKDITDIIQSGIKAPSSKNRQPWKYITSAKYTIDIMAEAPTIIFVVNTLGKGIMEELTPEERIYEICNIQSIGASIQNMLLAATEKGIGSLWICDIYFAYPKLCKWLDSDGQLIAAIALCYLCCLPFIYGLPFCFDLDKFKLISF